jgi:hypothetical protein
MLQDSSNFGLFFVLYLVYLSIYPFLIAIEDRIPSDVRLVGNMSIVERAR